MCLRESRLFSVNTIEIYSGLIYLGVLEAVGVFLVEMHTNSTVLVVLLALLALLLVPGGGHWRRDVCQKKRVLSVGLIVRRHKYMNSLSMPVHSLILIE